MIAGGLALVAAGLLMMMAAGADSQWITVLPGSMLASIGTGLFNPAMTGVALGSAWSLTRPSGQTAADAAVASAR
jgi:hypothetical protein